MRAIGLLRLSRLSVVLQPHSRRASDRGEAGRSGSVARANTVGMDAMMRPTRRKRKTESFLW